MGANTECRAKGEAPQKFNRCAISTQGKDINKIFSMGNASRLLAQPGPSLRGREVSLY
jgi:hypothetical protein